MSTSTKRSGAAIFAGLATIITFSTRARGQYGPDTCITGFVWREAIPGDHVCVTPNTRQQVANDNALAQQRRNPGGGPHGPDACIPGFVWREAYRGDHVCVTPATRSQTARDNALKYERQKYPYICVVCNDGSCQCGHEPNACATRGGVNTSLGCSISHVR